MRTHRLLRTTTLGGGAVRFWESERRYQTTPFLDSMDAGRARTIQALSSVAGVLFSAGALFASAGSGALLSSGAGIGVLLAFAVLSVAIIAGILTPDPAKSPRKESTGRRVRRGLGEQLVPLAALAVFVVIVWALFSVPVAHSTTSSTLYTRAIPAQLDQPIDVRLGGFGQIFLNWSEEGGSSPLQVSLNASGNVLLFHGSGFTGNGGIVVPQGEYSVYVQGSGGTLAYVTVQIAYTWSAPLF